MNNSKGGKDSNRGGHHGGKGKGSSNGGGSGGRGGGNNNNRGGGGGRGGRGGGNNNDRGGRGGGYNNTRGGLTMNQKTEIATAKREPTLQISSEGTDDVIIAAADKDNQHFASFVLRKKEFTEFNGQRQIRSFVSSCLLNLSNHHSADTSGILSDLASTKGIARMSEILTKRMSVDAADHRDVLSFQYVVLPFIGVLTRESVCQSTMTRESGIIYSTVYMNRKTFLKDGVLPCMSELIRRRSIKDTSVGAQKFIQQNPSIPQPTSLQGALLTITRLVYQLIKRTQDARIDMADVVKTLHEQQLKFNQDPSDSADNRYLNELLEREVTRLRQIIADASDTIIHPIITTENINETHSLRRGPNKVHIALAYDPPGRLSKYGPRHDNDLLEITDIKLLPTQDEIICQRAPFLPSNGIHDAPHFLPQGWRRQLDTHFRLYREDMLNSLRKGVMGFLTALERTGKGNEELLLKQKELRKYMDDDVSLNVYGNVQFMGMNCTKQLSGSIGIAFAQPPNLVGTSHKRRVEFWERSKKRVMQGALVCIVSRVISDAVDTKLTPKEFQMILGVVTERSTEALAKDEKFAQIHISLTDPKDYLITMTSTAQSKTTQWFLVESLGGFFESYRPILKALQKCVPASLPFGKYIAPSKEDIEKAQTNGGTLVDPPLYARAPRFTFDLSILLKGRACRLNVSDPLSINAAERTLQHHREHYDKSSLDETQVKALIETLCREVALISGPPGTGKTRIGVDLMRVLLHNKKAMNCGPILCICYTNHALDQFLEHLLDIKVKNIVRVGARSKSERLDEYNLGSLMRSRDRPFAVRQSLRAADEDWEEVSTEIKKLEEALRDKNLQWDYVGSYLQLEYYDFWEQLLIMPHLSPIFEDNQENNDSDGNGEYTAIRAENNTRRKRGPYYNWISGKDINDNIRHNDIVKSRLENNSPLSTSNMYDNLSLSEAVLPTPPRSRPENSPDWRAIPTSNRPLRQLKGTNVWKMSMSERIRLQNSWKPDVHKFMMDEMDKLLERVEEINQTKVNAFDDMRRGILREASVIGMTTNGAAKYQTLVGAVAPKIIICEEAGEVLESHILATLSVSTQHLILIGDHLQLRPSIENYNLSSDSSIGQNYNLDKSLFERLVTDTVSPFPLSRLTIQRRMRPEISRLIRNTLYNNLEDGERVHSYPPVSGMGCNLFFMDHAHPEDSKDQFGMQSFANTFEVQMIETLAQYLIKNGYNKPGDIAVLTPYLGQLSKLRDHLRNSFMLTIDERDQEQLDQKDVENENNNVNESIGVKRIGLNSHLTLRTIDNYQGEEAKIVIISLVRSNAKSNGSLTGSTSIGFLKSPNRTNVLLSRAQHGMYILGNASLMEGNSRNGLWPQVLQDLRTQGRVGEGFPIICKNHPHIANIITEPNVLKIVAPNGGCTMSCGRSMPCGHTCPLNCHPDDKEHVLVKCFEPCPRLHSVCEHVCPKRCGDKCGDCMEIVPSIVLSCGHVFKNPRCYQAKDPSKINCQVKITHKFPTCEHEKIVSCSTNLKGITCLETCGCNLPCGHKCEMKCSECQKTSAKDKAAVEGLIKRTIHGKCKTKCGRSQFCGHPCATACHGKNPCPPCIEKCEVACIHSSCQRKCNEACAACCERCTWSCLHQGRCEMPCGAPCDRLPCNLRCEKILKCGHRCPSVCGEKCPSSKWCVECKDPSTMSILVDVYMNQTLEEVDVEDDPIMELPCGHALTMMSLDGMMQMAEYYESEMDRNTGDVTYTGKKALSGSEVSQISCHLCRKPIIGINRYGRRIKVAQLTQRSKKFQLAQAKQMREAQQAFDVNRALVEEEEAKFFKDLEKCPPTSCENPPKASQRLGKTLVGQVLPLSNITDIAKIYEIPEEHEKAWRKFIKPAVDSMNAFGNINKAASKSPSKRLFDAAVSHLYRIKVTPTFDTTSEQVTQPPLPEQTATASEVVQACILECGLPRDGHSGSSFVDSLQERTNVLIFVVSKTASIISRMDRIHSKTGTNSGWYWFMEDLLKCANAHVEKLLEASQKSMRDRTGAIARLIRMDLIIRMLQLIAAKTMPTEETEKEKRLERANELREQFMVEYNFIKHSCPLGIKEECLSKANDLEEKLTLSVKEARGESIYTPLTHDEKVMLIRAIEQRLSGTGRWYQCPNGHSYVIDNCGMAMETSTCPECGAPVGGARHTLLSSNSVNNEFESLRPRE
ncbi:hypothetical protein BGZ49_006382 [Haplosporangium sp. Z 27]|nr:hypothetical protein BGZ49_006382 [Haplosporangium sp. Z 27]